MYQFSRSIYRELSPYVVEKRYPAGQTNRQKVLEASEATIRRLALDRRYFARPARTLFNDIRVYFPINEQRRVYRVIERNLSLAAEFLDRVPDALGIGGPARCQATTRKGRSCQREPLPGSGYCPSHKHLEELDRLDEMMSREGLEKVH